MSLSNEIGKASQAKEEAFNYLEVNPSIKIRRYKADDATLSSLEGVAVTTC